MSGKAGNGHSHRASILLVDDDSTMRSLRAVMLSAHGYDVGSASNSAEAQSAWEVTRPDLVLVAFSRYSKGTLEFLEAIKRVSPQQRVAFLNGESLHLAPLFYNGELIRKAEGPGDFLERVGALLAVL
ncbi:MAG TPA: response regulator [Terriglobales bacterium]|nr:response regulator [Terriglobales bacterium]